MKVNRTMAVALMVALGFSKATDWDNATLATRVAQIPAKVGVDEVPEGYEDLYKKLSDNTAPVAIVDDAASGKIDVTLLNKAALRALIEERQLAVKVTSKTSLEDLQKAVGKALDSAKPAPAKKESPLKGTKVAAAEPEVKAPAAKPAAKPAKEAKPVKAPKIPKVVKAPVEKDAFGCKLGTFSAAVNATLSKDWKDEDVIVKEAGITTDQARGRLYYAAEKGIIEYRRLIQYRLLPKAPAAAKK